MERAQFWAMVEAARPASGEGCEQHTTNLVAALLELLASEILDYRRIQRELLAESYRWNLWGAAHLLGGGGCSDDGFDDFRGWLLTQGRATWQGAFRDPDSLAAHPQMRGLPPDLRWLGGSFQCEAMLYVTYDATSSGRGQTSRTTSPARVDRLHRLATDGIRMMTSSCADAIPGCSPGCTPHRRHAGADRRRRRSRASPQKGRTG